MQPEPGDVGAWLFGCDPDRWDIRAALGAGHRIDKWRVRYSPRLDLIQPGDPAVLWVGGSDFSEVQPGIWAVGYTTGKIFEGREDDGFWTDSGQGTELTLYAGLIMWPLEAVLSRERIVGRPATSGLEILRRPQISNPSYLTPAEKAAVFELIAQQQGRIDAEAFRVLR